MQEGRAFAHEAILLLLVLFVNAPLLGQLFVAPQAHLMQPMLSGWGRQDIAVRNAYRGLVPSNPRVEQHLGAGLHQEQPVACLPASGSGHQPPPSSDSAGGGPNPRPKQSWVKAVHRATRFSGAAATGGEIGDCRGAAHQGRWSTFEGRVVRSCSRLRRLQVLLLLLLLLRLRLRLLFLILLLLATVLCPLLRLLLLLLRARSCSTAAAPAPASAPAPAPRRATSLLCLPPSR